MATKNISITVQAYNRLARLKKENESFSIVIERLTGKKKVKLGDYFGIVSKEAGEALEKSIMEGRKLHRRLRKKRIMRLQKQFSQ